jgi:hypothetical protein
MLIPNADSAPFPVLYARKTRALYVAMFEKFKPLMPQFIPSFAMADFEKHPFLVSDILRNWFFYAQAIVTCANKIGLKDAYQRDNDVRVTVQCLLGLPLLYLSLLPLMTLGRQPMSVL